MRGSWLALAAGLLAPTAALAQDAGIGAPCGRSEVPQSARQFCYAVAQAAESAQPQIGILITGGNPTPGTASTGGLRLGFVPGVSATGKVNFVVARVPDISREGAESSQGNDQQRFAVPALSGTASLGVFPGISLAPTIGGIGAVDLLGAFTWLPLKVEAVEGFSENTASTSFGAGARVGLLKESFTMPGASVSVMYHKLGKVEYGVVCESPQVIFTDTEPDYRLESGACAGAGDPGEFSFDLSNWSTRAQVSKHFLIVGVAAGVGYDRWNSDVGYGFRSQCPFTGGQSCFVRVRDASMDNDRWSVFGNAVIGGLLGSIVLEAGWLQGDEPIAGFNAASEFDPNESSLFGSVGLRIAL